jgi:Mg2+ and Co2+ transporter CorA
MGSFKQYLAENEELLAKITAELDELSDEELGEFGEVLYYEFFDDEESDEDNYDFFDKEDILAMIKELGADMYSAVYDMLEEIEDEEEDLEEKLKPMKGDNPCWEGYVMVGTKLKDGKEVPNCVPEEDVTEEMLEAVSRIMKGTNKNRKKRKFMKNSKADLRKTKTKRKQDARKSRAKRKRYYRANKAKISAYQKSRAAAIKKGTHKVKKRRSA